MLIGQVHGGITVGEVARKHFPEVEEMVSFDSLGVPVIQNPSADPGSYNSFNNLATAR